MTTIIVSSGQTSTGLTLGNGDQVYIDGGTTYFTTLNYGGIESSYAGGESFYTVINSGGLAEVGSAGAAEYSVVASGGVLVVNADGRTDGTTMIAGGSTYVFNGGLAEATIVESGGVETVSSGGTTDQTTVYGAGAVLSVGDEAFVGDNTSNGVATDTRLFSGGSLLVDDDGKASGTVISAGGLLSAGFEAKIVSTTISSGGVQTLEGTAVGDYTTIYDGGTDIVGELGGSFYASVNSGGIQIVSGFDQALSVNNAHAFYTVINGGGVQELMGDARGVGVIVEAGGAQLISSGAVVSSTTISSGGYENVYSNGTAGSTMVAAGGEQYILDGGSATDTMLYGTQVLFSGAVASETYVGDNAKQYVLAGGSTDFTTIASGGYEIVSSGGTATDTLIESGGMLDLAGLIYTSGGTITSSTLSQVVQAAARPEASIETTTLTITEGDQTVTLQLAGDYTGEYFHLAPAPGGLSGTILTVDDTPTCFAAGTRILTDHGEVIVEELNIGDVLLTRSGGARPIKWIGHRSYAGWLAAGNASIWPICFAPGSLADGVPTRELRVSPEHGMWLEGVLVPAGLLVNDSSIVRSGVLDEVHYFHLELDTHDIIFAEGAAAESFVDDDSRGIFHNVADFHARYPDVLCVPASFCAPRVEDGFELDAIRRRLAGRAEQLAADGTAATARLTGYLEVVDRSMLGGWVMDRAASEQRVSLTVFDNGVEIGRVVADRFRADLAGAGIGDGKHSFAFYLPGRLAPDLRHVFELRSAEGWVLPALACPALEPEAPVSTATQGAPKAGRDEAGQDEAGQDEAGQDGPVSPGALRGYLDVVNRTEIGGWALDCANPNRSVGLVALANGRIIARVLANTLRRDLRSAGIGSGRHGFAIRIPPGLLGLEAQEIRVIRELDGAELQHSPIHLPAPRDLDTDTQTQLSAVFAGLDGNAAEERGLALLARETRTLLERRAARQGLRAEREALARHRRRWGPAAPDLPQDLVVAARRQALVIDVQAPCLGRDGGSVAILSHMRALAALGFAVSFAAADDSLVEEARAGLAQEGIAVCGQPYYGSVEDVLRLHASGFDLIYLHRHDCADRYLALARAYQPKARIVYSVADLHHVRLARQSQVEGRPELLAYSRRLASIEAHAAARADIVLTHSPAEAQLLRQAVSFDRVHVVPFAVGARPGRRRFAERHGLAFIGSFGHAPNADAVYVLAHDIMPLVWAQDPSITCRIAGHGWHAARLPGLDPRLEILGPTNDLDGLLDSVRLTVAPLRFGAGIKAKVLDSFAAGVPCVMTGIAAEGLPLAGPLAIPVADAADLLAGHILRLHADQTLNERIGEAAARLVADHFNAARVIGALGEALLERTGTHRSNWDENDRRPTSQRFSYSA